MKLYHGTNEAAARAALENGLKPRGTTGLGNWANAPSHPKCVYLTDAYPLYFAISAVKLSEAGEPQGRAAIIEIETDELWHQHNLLPDEDVLEQSGRRFDGIAGTMEERTAHYRKRLWTFKGTEAWRASLKAMGTCAHWGILPSMAITRVAYVELSDQPWLTMAAMDAHISLSNYAVCAGKYRAMTAHVFGDEHEFDNTDPLAALEGGHDFTRFGRKGIDIIA